MNRKKLNMMNNDPLFLMAQPSNTYLCLPSHLPARPPVPVSIRRQRRYSLRHLYDLMSYWIFCPWFPLLKLYIRRNLVQVWLSSVSFQKCNRIIFLKNLVLQLYKLTKRVQLCVGRLDIKFNRQTIRRGVLFPRSF